MEIDVTLIVSGYVRYTIEVPDDIDPNDEDTMGDAIDEASSKAVDKFWKEPIEQSNEFDIALDETIISEPYE